MNATRFTRPISQSIHPGLLSGGVTSFLGQGYTPGHGFSATAFAMAMRTGLGPSIGLMATVGDAMRAGLIKLADLAELAAEKPN